MSGEEGESEAETEDCAVQKVAVSRDFLYFFHESNPPGLLTNSQKCCC